MIAPVVLKFGGELLEDSSRMDGVVSAIAEIFSAGTPLVIVHGGGKEIDAALKTAGIETLKPRLAFDQMQRGAAL